VSGRTDAEGPGHVRRRAARRQAVDLLYQADVMDRSPSDVLEEWRAAGRHVYPYAAELITGVERTLLEIDEQLGRYSEEWTVSRMAAVDRTILRVASFELRSGLATAVTINEAVRAAKELSTEDSGRFVNGILGRIARESEAADPDSNENRGS
jgi:N utilization substance protein B